MGAEHTQPTVQVTMNMLEVRIFRRAVAEATDEGLLSVRQAAEIFNRLDGLCWEAVQGAEGREPRSGE